MGFESLQDVLNKSLRRGPIKAAVLAVTVEKNCQETLPPWARMVSFRQGRLIISAPSPSHTQELYLQSKEIIRKINEGLGRKIVAEMRFRVTPAVEPA